MNRSEQILGLQRKLRHITSTYGVRRWMMDLTAYKETVATFGLKMDCHHTPHVSECDFVTVDGPCACLSGDDRWADAMGPLVYIAAVAAMERTYDVWSTTSPIVIHNALSEIDDLGALNVTRRSRTIAAKYRAAQYTRAQIDTDISEIINLAVISKLTEPRDEYTSAVSCALHHDAAVIASLAARNAAVRPTRLDPGEHRRLCEQTRQRLLGERESWNAGRWLVGGTGEVSDPLVVALVAGGAVRDTLAVLNTGEAAVAERDGAFILGEWDDTISQAQAQLLLDALEHIEPAGQLDMVAAVLGAMR